MAKDEIHRSDIGTILKTIVRNGDDIVDISSATTKNIILGKPDNTLLTKSGTFTTDGTDGQLQYTTIADDLDQVGWWKLQTHVISSSGNWKSDISNFEVHKNI